MPWHKALPSSPSSISPAMAQISAHRPRPHGIVSTLCIYLAAIARCVQVTAVRHCSTIDGKIGPLDCTNSRGLLQQTAESSSSDGVFATVSPCPSLLEIVTETPDVSRRLGNFTVIPSEETVRECSGSSSIFLLNGPKLADAFNQSTPLIKVVTLEPSDPTVWPSDTVALHLAQGSINMVDCRNGLLDLRNRNFDLVIEDATVVYLRCQVVFPDVDTTWSTLTYFYSSASIYPCNGTGELSKTADFPRSEPGFFSTLTANLGADSTMHVRNSTVWCYTAADIADLYDEVNAESLLYESDGDGSLPGWAPWVITVSVLLILGGVAAGVWVWCGRPCCSCTRRSPEDAHKSAQPTSLRHQQHPSSPPHTSFRSAEELAAALSTVLQTHRLRNGPQLPDTVSMSSGPSQYHNTSYSLRECPDCRHPHPVPGNNPRLHGKPSLRVQSQARTGSGSDPSASAGMQGSEQHQCTQCSAQLGPLVERHRSINDLHRDDAERTGQPRSFTKQAKHELDHRYVGVLTSDMGNKSTDAWVEDSLEARAAIAAGIRLGPDRERFSDIDSLSIDERYSGTSISLAPYRRGPSSTPMDAASGHHRRQSRGILGLGIPSGPPTEHSEYYDAQEAYSQSQSANSSPRNMPSACRMVDSQHDAESEREHHWRPSQNGFNSPRGSPRHAAVFADSPPAHPRLKEYRTPPPNHPILKHVSPAASPGQAVDGRNDLEGTR